MAYSYLISGNEVPVMNYAESGTRYEQPASERALADCSVGCTERRLG